MMQCVVSLYEHRIPSSPTLSYITHQKKSVVAMSFVTGVCERGGEEYLQCEWLYPHTNIVRANLFVRG